MNLEETVARLDTIEAELEKLASYTRPTQAQADRSAALADEGEKLLLQLADHDKRIRRIGQLHRAGGGVAGASFGPGDDPTRLVAEDRGRRTIDDAFRSGLLPDHAAEKAIALIDSGHPGERSLAGRWAATAGAPAYRDAFAKMLADPTRGHLLWTAEEADAYRAVAAVQAEMESRTAMSTTVGNGGYMIPLTLDPAIMLTNDGSNNPLRRLATVKQTLTNTWQGVTSAGATSEWKAEGAQAADGSPTLGGPSIPVFMGDSFVPYSFEVGMDAVNFLAELTAVLVDSADNLMAVAYTTGGGTTDPQGIVTGLAGTASEINTTGTETYDDSDPYALQNALPARFSANASYQAHIATLNAYRQMETTNGSILFPELRDSPPRLLGKPFHENSNMDGALNAAATANNYVMVYGDIARAFFIVDRVGSTLELIPNLVGANQRPTGQRGALLWFRTGSEVVVPQAARLLDIPTTA
jgi:HK97 family phage major capsid protein